MENFLDHFHSHYKILPSIVKLACADFREYFEVINIIHAHGWKFGKCGTI